MTAIHVVNAKKNYGATQALKGVSLEVPEGEFFGLLGPNGAGKTTLIQSVVGLVHLTEGQIDIMGQDTRVNPARAKAVIGYSPQDLNLDRFFPIRKMLMYQAGFFGIGKKDQKRKADQLLEQFGLTEKAGMPYYRLSGGMQKRVLIAKAVISNPRILILDEPTAGVDVEQRHELWKFLRMLNRDGTTIILTTHYIDEAEALCERIGIIDLGTIREMGSPQELIEKYCVKRVKIKTQNVLATVPESLASFESSLDGDTLILSGSDVGSMVENAMMALKKTENKILDVSIDRGSLEDVFIKLTGKSLAQGAKDE